mmetsp:Transcript_16210/g.44917  ORF Transcript_16210/g.44917 Transcript_16210/m.44917 type:complete len:184 (-) Transcript_16210:191-742(-)
MQSKHPPATTHRPIHQPFSFAFLLCDLLLLASCLFSGKFPIGVSKYLFWPETTWQTHVTCTHHLWTIPIILWTCGRVHVVSWSLSFLVMTLNVVLSRWLTPFYVTHPKTDYITDGSAQATKYLNVNLSHELWKDITFSFLQINHGNPNAEAYLFRLLWRWQGLNTIVFIVLHVAGLWIQHSRC